jgi:hypothetical protein
MKNTRIRQAPRRRGRPEISKVTASTLIERRYFELLEMQARTYSVDLDFLTARILEMGLMAWSELEPYQVQALLLAAKRVSPSLLLGDSQPLHERRIN